MNSKSLAFIAALIFAVLFAQDSLSLGETEVMRNQRLRTTKVLRYLESGKSDSILPMISRQYSEEDTAIGSKLRSVSGEIQKVKGITQVSNGLILYENDFNIFCCRYYSKDTAYVEVNIYYLNTDKSATIVKFEFFDKKELMEERERLRKANEESPEPPPPPLPPKPQ